MCILSLLLGRLSRFICWMRTLRKEEVMMILCIWAAISLVAGWMWRLYHATGDGRLFNYPVHLSSRRYEAADPTEVRGLIPLSVQSSDDYGLLLQVVFDGLLAMLAAYARVLHPSERKLVVTEVELVHPGHACLYLLGSTVYPLHVMRVDGGPQTISRVVGEPYRLIHIVHLEDRQQRSESLLAHHAAVVRGVLDHGRLEK